MYSNQGTPVVVVALAVASFTYGGLLGAFALGILWSRANQRDALTGMALGIAVMTVVVFAKPLAAAYPALADSLGPLARIAWPWYVLIGTSITLLVGVLSSFTHARVGAERGPVEAAA
jgi:Na+/proline symporter